MERWRRTLTSRSAADCERALPQSQSCGCGDGGTRGLSGDLHHPETGAPKWLDFTIERPNLRLALVGDKCICNFDAIRRIIHQERLQQKLFVPALKPLEQPFPWIIERKEYVVQVDEHSFPKTGQDLKEEPVYVARGVTTVGTVVKEHISGTKCLEPIERATLENGLHAPPIARKLVQQLWPGIGFD